MKTDSPYITAKEFDLLVKQADLLITGVINPMIERIKVFERKVENMASFIDAQGWEDIR